ncbi:MAG: heavy metal transporter [Geobacteraceae bacterium GWC2_58_44]|nr:MAG: heavy metal transporter [Geobacteraceae bacterium GWC2_58_44]
MNAKTISTSILVIAAVTVLVVFAFRVRIGATADSVAVLKTTGMTCGSCSSRITKALESVKGVAVTEVDVNGGWVIVGYDQKAVKPERLAERVAGTGFSSKVSEVLTPEQFRQITGRNVGQNAAPSSGGCGGGCGANKPS